MGENKEGRTLNEVVETKEKYEKPEISSVKMPEGMNIAASGCEHPHEGAKERCIEW